MNRLREIRTWSEKINIKREILFTLSVFILGLLFGYVAKATDSVSIFGEIGTDLGIWVFIVSLVAAFSSRPLFAIINTPILFVSMLLSYYVYGQIVFGFFPKTYFIGWLIIALISPIGGFIVWLSRGKGIFANISAAIPSSILFACGYPAVYTKSPVLVLDLFFAILLLILLPKTWKERAIATGTAIILCVAIVQLHLISYLPW